VSPWPAALDAAIKWAVPAFAGTCLTVVTVRHRAITDWRRKRAATRKAVEAMAEAFPTVTGQASLLVAEFQKLHRRMDSQDKDLGDLLAMNYGQFELSSTAPFVCDHEGRNTLANSAYGRMLHTGRDDLMGYGYRRFIPDVDLAGYLPKFQAAARDHREFESELCMRCADGAELRVRGRMVPPPRQQGPATHWIGTVTLLEGHC